VYKVKILRDTQTHAHRQTPTRKKREREGARGRERERHRVVWNCVSERSKKDTKTNTSFHKSNCNDEYIATSLSTSSLQKHQPDKSELVLPGKGIISDLYRLSESAKLRPG
jgi:cation transport regulator ChaB